MLFVRSNRTLDFEGLVFSCVETQGMNWYKQEKLKIAAFEKEAGWRQFLMQLAFQFPNLMGIIEGAPNMNDLIQDLADASRGNQVQVQEQAQEALQYVQQQAGGGSDEIGMTDLPYDQDATQVGHKPLPVFPQGHQSQQPQQPQPTQQPQKTI